MSSYFIDESSFNDFVDNMSKDKRVHAPVAKKTKFVFGKLSSHKDLRLDYDLTILPPKKEFFPTCQTLVKFDEKGYEGCINPLEKIIFGVHFYDMKAIDMTDYLFSEKHEDWNYLANRKASTIVVSNIQSVSTRAFWSSVGTEIDAKGHDAYLTKLSGGYVFETFTDKGEKLLSYGKFEKATDTQIEEAIKVNNDVLDKCPEKLNGTSAEIAKAVRANFDNEEFWKECAKDCFSCGSCNVICPTCYCFDVQDNWNLDQKSGDRNRYWDACLTEDFAKVSLGGGAEENFRDKRGERFRHRIMRKSVYSNEKLGTPACVGCGRCSIACTADIADPTTIINKILEVK